MMEIFKGNDGKVSGRRVLGTLFLFLGGGLSIHIQIIGFNELLQLAPAGLCMFVGLFLWGAITAQNITNIVRAKSGQNP